MKKILTFALAVSMMASLAASASALEYSIAPPKDFDFGRDTSIEVIHTADGGAMRNTDMSKSAALIPPTFGSESMNALHTGEYLTPNLAPGGIPASGAAMLYSNAYAGAARAAVMQRLRQRVMIFFILYPPHPRFLFCASPAAHHRRPRLPRPRSQWG